jgi:hypothetical protein
VARVRADLDGRRQVIVLANAFGGQLADTADDQVVVQLTDEPEVLDEFARQLESWPDRLVYRSGAVALSWDAPAAAVPWRPQSTSTELVHVPSAVPDRPLIDPDVEFEEIIRSFRTRRQNARA